MRWRRGGWRSPRVRCFRALSASTNIATISSRRGCIEAPTASELRSPPPARGFRTAAASATFRVPALPSSLTTWTIASVSLAPRGFRPRWATAAREQSPRARLAGAAWSEVYLRAFPAFPGGGQDEACRGRVLQRDANFLVHGQLIWARASGVGAIDELTEFHGRTVERDEPTAERLGQVAIWRGRPTALPLSRDSTHSSESMIDASSNSRPLGLYPTG